MTVEKLEIKVTTDAGKAAEQFNSLSKALEGIQSSAVDVGKKAKKATEPLGDSIRSQIEEAGRYEIALHKVQAAEERMLKAFQKGNENSAWRAREQGLNAEAAVEKYAPKVPLATETQEMIEAASAMEVLQAKAESINAALQQAFASGDQDKAYALRGQIIKVNEQMERLENAAKKAAEAEKQTANATEKVANAAKKANKPLGNFISSLKRIAFYRIIRGIIKSITQALSEGLEKAYLFSSGIVGEGNRFAQAMDSIKSKGNEMKGQLGSAFIGLLTAIEPILVRLTEIVTKVADAISQFFAAFTGRTYIKANATAAKFADTMARGGAAAKEWKNQLLGFDEINRLNEPSSGGGGSSTNPLDGYAFVDAPINQKLLDFINNIKERLQPAIDRLKESFGRLKDAWDRFIENFDGAPLAQFFEDLVSLPIEVIINSLTVLCDTLTLVLDVLTALNTGDWSRVWIDFKQLLYDVIVLVTDLFVGITNLVMDALIALAGAIDGVIGTHFADYLQAGKDAFNEMYTASRDSEDGLWGLKRVLGLTETSTEKLAEETQGLTVDLEGVGAEADDLNTRVSGVRGAVDWVLDGFRGFGAEVGWIITSLFQPLADLAAWIDSVLQGFGLLSKVNSPTYNVWEDPDMWTSNFATGGFPTEGQLFVANEAGPELVGTMGGHTAVANNDQIVEGIRQGVYDAVVAANANGNSDVSVKVYLDSREIRAGQERLARAWG